MAKPSERYRTGQAVCAGTCGGFVYISRTSLPAGQATCRPCRAALAPLSPVKAPRAPRQTTDPKGSSTARGYGVEHRQARAWYIAQHNPGDPCARCGEGMWDDPRQLDLDHTDDRTGYLGLSHRTCNRTHGQGQHPRGRNQRAPRVCERCTAVYQPSHTYQRYCGRACAAKVKATTRPTRGGVKTSAPTRR